MGMKANRPLDFWDKFGNAVDKLKTRKVPKGQEESFANGMKKLQKARYSRDIDGASEMMQQLLDSHAAKSAG